MRREIALEDTPAPISMSGSSEDHAGSHALASCSAVLLPSAPHLRSALGQSLNGNDTDAVLIIAAVAWSKANTPTEQIESWPTELDL